MHYLKARKLWADALRSGDYKQGQGSLHNQSNEYCCLGVACDLYQKHVGGMEEGVDLDDHSRHYDEEGAVAPEKVCNWLNITKHGLLRQNVGVQCCDDEDCEDSHTVGDLVDANDELGLSFDEIADIIDDNLLADQEYRPTLWQSFWSFVKRVMRC